MEKLGHTDTIVQEYEKLTSKDAVVRSAQSTINILCDYMRKMMEDNMDEFRGDTSATYVMGTINIRSYLLRKNMLLQNGLAAPLRRDGIVNLYELCAEGETQMNRRIRITDILIPDQNWP